MTPSTEKHKPRLGLTAATSYLIGMIIGSGIFITPQSILKHTGSVGLDLIIWTACGCLSYIGAMSYLELGTSIPLSGGDFSYLCYVKWHPVAFAFLWTTVIIFNPCSLAIQVKTLGTYFMEAIVPLVCMETNISDIAGRLIGFGFLCK